MSPTVDPGRGIDELRAGTTLGRYLVLEPLGAGASGTVVKAYDPELDRHVAIKVLHATLGSQADQERLLAEARATARVSHPHVVAIHDVGVNNGHLFIAMELVQGGDLDHWVGTTTRRWRDTLRVCRDFGQGIAAAHCAGLVHRNLKSSNILVTSNGCAKVTDFGLDLPNPETQHASQDLETGTQADQFGYCAAAFKALYGQVPDLGTSPPRTPVPKRVHKVLARGLAPDPKDRYPSMLALLAELEPARHWRRWALLGVACVLIATLPWTAFGPKQAQVHYCDDLERHLHGVWNEQQAQTVQANVGLELEGDPTRTQRATRIVQRLDAFAHDWLAGQAHTCGLQQRQHASTALVAARMECYQTLRSAFTTLVDTLSDPTTPWVRIPIVVSALPDAKRCAALGEPIDVTSQPSPTQVAAVTELRAALESVGILEAAGRYADAKTVVLRVQALADRTAYAPVLAELELARAQLLDRTGQRPAAQELYRKALLNGLRGRYLSLAAKGYKQLAAIAISQWTSPEHALDLCDRADASIVGSGVKDPELRAQIENLRAIALRRLERSLEALESGNHALALRQAAALDKPWILAEPLFSIGSSLSRLGRHEEAMQTFTRGTELFTAHYGVDHPSHAALLQNMATALSEAGADRQAAQLAQQALAVFRANFDESHPSVGIVLFTLAAAELNYGDFEPALDHARAALANELHNGTATSMNYTLVAEICTHLGRPDEAEPALRKALELTDADPNALPRQRTSTAALLGGVLVAQGRVGEARELLEQTRVKAEAHGWRRVRASVYTSLGELELVGSAGPEQALLARTWAAAALHVLRYDGDVLDETWPPGQQRAQRLLTDAIALEQAVGGHSSAN